MSLAQIMKSLLKRSLILLLAAMLVLSGLGGCAKHGISNPPSGDPPAAAEQPAIYPLQVKRTPAALAETDGVEPYGDYWFNATVSGDLRGRLGLAWSLTVGSDTRFSGDLPAGYDPEALIEWGKDPGLNVDILHAHGFTGKGAVIAYVDQPLPSHEQYVGAQLRYTNNTDSDSSMHGPAVLSLLAGQDIGVAPEAEVYYYAHAPWKADQTTHAACLYQIIEQNESLPEDRRIRMVGFSDNIDDSEENADAFWTAVAACEEAGVMVWFCGEYGSIAFTPHGDRNSYRSLSPSFWWQAGAAPGLVFVPDSGRTTAGMDGFDRYIYWSQGGLSWTMPYMLGLYAIAVEIDPSLTQDELRQLVVATAHRDDDGRPIVDPVSFVAAALRRVGRDGEAQAMEDEVKARTRYLYAVMNTAAMSPADLEAVGSYLAAFTDATVLVADAARFRDVSELYRALQADARARGGTVAGVQLFGTASMVPSFRIRYRVRTEGEPDEGGSLLTDLFFGNFNNDVSLLGLDYSVLDHFEQGWDVDLTPRWPVVRLPLEQGEFAPFLERYRAFVLDTGLTRLDLVNFSNPIFNTRDPVDSMGRFLMRMDTEFRLLDVPCRLYGNLLGDAAVTYDVLGGFDADTLAAENGRGPAEFIINSHGQANNIDNAYFVDGLEMRMSLINGDAVNRVLGENPYYLDTWTCLNGYGMEHDLTTAALNGKCVGMFSATAILSNNGVNWNASLEDMTRSNFYYFYYAYLKALHEGRPRSEAFFAAQQAYCQALLEHSRAPLSGGANYQYNLYNLLAYHNFGVMEPNAACLALYTTSAVIQPGRAVAEQDEAHAPATAFPAKTMAPAEPQTTAAPSAASQNGPRPVSFWVDDKELRSGSITVHNAVMEPLNNGYTRFTVRYTMPRRLSVFIFNAPEADVVRIDSECPGSTEPRDLVFEIRSDILPGVDLLAISFYQSDEDRCFVLLDLSSVR